MCVVRLSMSASVPSFFFFKKKTFSYLNVIEFGEV